MINESNTMPKVEPTGEPKVEIPQATIELLEAYSVNVEQSPLLTEDRATVEKTENIRVPGRRDYGALPHFDLRSEALAGLPEEMAKLTNNGEYFQPGQAPWFIDASYAQAPILFEMKFGTKLSAFAEDILKQYPDLNEGKSEEEKVVGQEIAVFGLSGSGKSTAVEAIRDQLGEDAIVMDSDTVRYNLLAKALKDVEIDEGGADLEEVRNNLLHNSISGPLYLLLNKVTKELKKKGYTIIQSATMPSFGADKSIYIEHPDGLDPSDDEQVPVIPEEPKEGEEESEEEKTTREAATSAAKEKIAALAKDLYERTASRVDGADDYDWDNAETVLNFNEMKPVTVQVPEHVHGIFLSNTKGILARGGAIRVKNPQISDPEKRAANFRKQFEKILSEE